MALMRMDIHLENYAPFQNPLPCQPQLYSAATSQPMLQFHNFLRFGDLDKLSVTVEYPVLKGMVHLINKSHIKTVFSCAKTMTL